MESIVAAVVIIVIVALAVGYIYKAKKNGAKCIGCPESKACAAACGSCGCEGTRPEELSQKEFLDYGCSCGCCGCDGDEEND